MTIGVLVKAGLGTWAELESLDTTEFLDRVEFMEISGAIERHMIDKARNDGSR